MAQTSGPNVLKVVFINNITCSAEIEAQYNGCFVTELQPNSEFVWYIVSLTVFIYHNYEQQ